MKDINENKIEKLDGYELDTGKTGYYDNLTPNMEDVKITERNLTTIVQKINEIIEILNQ